MSFTKERFFRSTGRGLPLRIRPYFIDFHKLTVVQDCAYPVHTHDNYELIVVECGPYRCILNESHVSIDQGEFLIVKPGDSHGDLFAEGQLHYVLHFKLKCDAINTESNIRLFDENINSIHQTGNALKANPFQFFKNLKNELDTSDSFSGYIQDSMLDTFFWQLIRALPREILSKRFQHMSNQREFIDKLTSVFENFFDKGLTVEEMGALMGISQRKLTYQCREFMGQSPGNAFAVYRVEKAKEKLSQCDLTIQQVSNQMGFENQFHFSRVFKKITGNSPKKYRENLKK